MRNIFARKWEICFTFVRWLWGGGNLAMMLEGLFGMMLEGVSGNRRMGWRQKAEESLSFFS